MLLGGIVLAVLVAEGLLRWLYREQLKIQARPEIYVEDPLLGYRYARSMPGWICVPSITKRVTTNAQGYFGPPFEPEKEPGSLRLAVVDASEGTGLYMQEGLPYPALLQESFERQGVPVEVLNFTIDGSFRELAMLRQIETEVLGYSPDLVLARLALRIPATACRREYYRGYVYNPGNLDCGPQELQRHRRQVRRYVDRLETSFASRIYRASFLFRAYHRWRLRSYAPPRDLGFDDTDWILDLETYHTRRVSAVPSMRLMDPEASLRRIELTQRACAERGAALVVLLPGADATFARALERRGVRALVIDKPAAPEHVHEHDGHLNEHGQAVYARRIERALRKQMIRSSARGR